jgi:tripartite-type tricarboxylate transporter receptor subunit TctC
MKQRILKSIALLAACAPLLGWAAWPDRPIRMVVPYAAGGGADNTARIVAQQMSTALGQPIVIENRPGAGGVIGADNVAKAAADGYTVLYDASAFSVNPSLRKLPFDATKDFIPVSLVATAPQILVVPVTAPYKTVAEFIDFARRNPGKLTFASSGGGTGSHLAGEALNEQAKLSLLHVPYKGGAPALTDVMGEQVSIYFGNVASTIGYVKGGKLRALAVSSRANVVHQHAARHCSASARAGRLADGEHLADLGRGQLQALSSRRWPPRAPAGRARCGRPGRRCCCAPGTAPWRPGPRTPSRSLPAPCAPRPVVVVGAVLHQRQVEAAQRFADLAEAREVARVAAVEDLLAAALDHPRRPQRAVAVRTACGPRSAARAPR